MQQIPRTKVTEAIAITVIAVVICVRTLLIPQSLEITGFLLSNATCFKSAKPPNAVAPQHSALSTLLYKFFHPYSPAPKAPLLPKPYRLG
ncbi:hypothetical protein I8748_12455 [Nostoc sp. CENA67]|uniref:Uncharacterized protein n=1 Tax=Amazonocrinis nigriterrae CENA67 TaxID=2794033 RepID=A0A8J7L742_9NOST|nr:hypothetical protein [Amazonocrinis nigriterrae]MBH8562984.1 hypothetical protein [Amazonocrinis nigriterrae CENA67]